MPYFVFTIQFREIYTSQKSTFPGIILKVQVLLKIMLITECHKQSNCHAHVHGDGVHAYVHGFAVPRTHVWDRVRAPPNVPPSSRTEPAQA